MLNNIRIYFLQENEMEFQKSIIDLANLRTLTSEQ